MTNFIIQYPIQITSIKQIFVSFFSLHLRVHQLLNNNLGAPVRNHRVSNAGGINIKDVFDVNGGPYGVAGQINQGYEPVVDDDDRNSLRLTPRNQVSWTNNQNGRM